MGRGVKPIQQFPLHNRDHMSMASKGMKEYYQKVTFYCMSL